MIVMLPHVMFVKQSRWGWEGVTRFLNFGVEWLLR